MILFKVFSTVYKLNVGIFDTKFQHMIHHRLYHHFIELIETIRAILIMYFSVAFEAVLLLNVGIFDTQLQHIIND